MARKMILEFGKYKLYTSDNGQKNVFTVVMNENDNLERIPDIWWKVKINVLYAKYLELNLIPYDVKIEVIDTNASCGFPPPIDNLKNIALFLKTKERIFSPI